MENERKPDLTLPLKRFWFDRIKCCDKRIEYREVKPHWDRRLKPWLNGGGVGKTVAFTLGYKRFPRIEAVVTKVDVGTCPYDGWDGLYYRIYFEDAVCLEDGGKCPRALDLCAQMKEHIDGFAKVIANSHEH